MKKNENAGSKNAHFVPIQYELFLLKSVIKEKEKDFVQNTSSDEVTTVSKWKLYTTWKICVCALKSYFS